MTEQEGGPPNDAIYVGKQTAKRSVDALRDWWMAVAADEVDRVAPKAVEYGSTDLYEIGRTLAFTQGKHDLTDAQMRELGIYFYIVGKMARWTDAVLEGRLVSDDTLHDIGVYVRMAQRVRAVGGWPFEDEVEK